MQISDFLLKEELFPGYIVFFLFFLIIQVFNYLKYQQRKKTVEYYIRPLVKKLSPTQIMEFNLVDKDDKGYPTTLNVKTENGTFIASLKKGKILNVVSA